MVGGDKVNETSHMFHSWGWVGMKLPTCLISGDGEGVCLKHVSNSNNINLSSSPVIVNFPLDEDPAVSIIAWTTTPWTLPSNVALCVHPDFNYVKVKGERMMGRVRACVCVSL